MNADGESVWCTRIVGNQEQFQYDATNKTTHSDHLYVLAVPIVLIFTTQHRNGRYGTVRYIKAEHLSLLTRRHSPSHILHWLKIVDTCSTYVVT